MAIGSTHGNSPAIRNVRVCTTKYGTTKVLPLTLTLTYILRDTFRRTNHELGPDQIWGLLGHLSGPVSSWSPIGSRRRPVVLTCMYISTYLRVQIYRHED